MSANQHVSVLLLIISGFLIYGVPPIICNYLLAWKLVANPKSINLTSLVASLMIIFSILRSRCTKPSLCMQSIALTNYLKRGFTISSDIMTVHTLLWANLSFSPNLFWQSRRFGPEQSCIIRLTWVRVSMTSNNFIILG